MDDLDHFHQRHRVEKMVTGKALRVLQAGGNRRDRQRGGVGDQHSLGRHDGLQLSEEGFFNLKSLDDRFNHQLAVAQLGQRRGQCHTRQTSGCGCGVHLALGHQFVPLAGYRFAGPGAGIGVLVEQLDLATGLRSDLGYALTHGTGAYDGDGFVACGHALAANLERARIHNVRRRAFDEVHNIVKRRTEVKFIAFLLDIADVGCANAVF